MMHSELPCDQEAPPCGATCGKTLLCGQHNCQERCHTGPCPATCRLLVDKSCACGLTQRRMPCSQPLRRAACNRTASTLVILEDLHYCPEAARMQTGGLAIIGRLWLCGCVALWLGERHALAKPSVRGAWDLRGARMQVREALHGHQELRAAPVQAPLLRRRLPALRSGAFWQSPMSAASHTAWGLLLLGHLHVCMCASHFSLAEKRCFSWHVCLRPPSGGCVRLQPCGRKLRCGNHLCPSPCHSGPCQPCPLSAPIACACGQTSYNTPCGTESAAKPPKCPEVQTANAANALCIGMGASRVVKTRP